MRFKKLLSLLMTAVMVMTLWPSTIFADVAPELTKTAEWVDQEAGLAKITLTTKGTPIKITTGADVVMVLDASTSMDNYATVQTEKWTTINRQITQSYGRYILVVTFSTESGHTSDPYYYYTNNKGDLSKNDQNEILRKFNSTQYEDGTTRWEVATDAVEALTDEVIPDTTSKNKLGLVVFSSSIYREDWDGNIHVVGEYPANTVECGLTNDSANITSVIPDSPGGLTNYSTALQRAYSMLNARTDKSRPGYVVFLTDGAPGYEGSDPTDVNWNGVNQIATLKSAGITIYTVGFGLTDSSATSRLAGYATNSSDYHNITDASELTGLLSDIGSSIVANVSIQDTIDTRYFTLANKPGMSLPYAVTAGTVGITGDKNFVWSLPSFSEAGETMEIYVQLKASLLNGNYPTNEVGSAYGTYKNQSGSPVNLPVTEDEHSSAVPELNVARNVTVYFHFVGENRDKATPQASQSVQINSRVTKPSVTVAPGYQITDWYEAASCTGAAFNFATPLSGNSTINLHARVDEDRSETYAYDVEFYKNDVLSETAAGSVWQGDPSVTLGSAKALRTGVYTNYTFQEARVGLSSYTQDSDEVTIQSDVSTVIKVYYTSDSVDLTFDRGEHGKFSAPLEQNQGRVTRSTNYDASFDATPGVTEDLGWQVAGWYEYGDATKTIISFPQTVTGAKLYVMKYEKKVADWKNVTFNLNDGTVAPYKVVNDILVGSSISNSDWPADPPKLGYEFKGWFTQDGTSGNWGNQFTQSSAVNASATVYAKWVVDNATVSFEIVGDTYGAHNPVDAVVQKGKTATEPTVTANKGYKVDGWYTDDACTKAFNFSNTAITADITLYAKVVVNPDDWTTITFIPGLVGQWQDGTAGFVVIDAIKGAAWSNYSNQVPAAPEQREIGWVLADAVQVWDKTLPSAADTIPDAGLVYTAVWTADNATVSFEVVGDAHGVSNPADVAVQKGKKATAPVVNVAKGYQLDGWYIDDACTNKFNFDEAILKNEKLYAKIVEKAEDWTTVTFKVGEHGKWTDNTTIDVILNTIKGAEWSTYSSQVPANPLQSEIGWKLANEAQVWDTPLAITTVPNTGSVYTAVWTEDNAKVSFEVVGDAHGANSPGEVAVQKGKTATAPTVTASKGYQVDGWYTNNACTESFDFSNTEITDDTTLFAKVVVNPDEWTTITFKAGDHGKWADNTTIDVVLNAIKGAEWSNYSTQVPANPLQSEIGWKLANEAQVWDTPLAITTVPNTDSVYTAVWTEDNATVSFEVVGDAHGASNPADVAVQKGKTATAPTVTASKGYQVDGWYTNNACTESFDFSNTEITDDTTLFAKVVVNPDEWTTITFKAGDHGQWADNTTIDVVLNAIKGAEWSNYSTQVPANPLQSEIGWKLANEAQVWDTPLAITTVPNTDSVYTAVWTEDNATVSFEVVGDAHGASNPADVAVQKGKTATAPTVTASKGYQVDGWYTNNACTESFDFSNTEITDDTTLFAKVVVNPDEWTTITFEPGNVGQWADGTISIIVIDAIKGAEWLNYSTQVPAAPVQTEIGWKLANEAQVWHRALPNATDTIPDVGLTFTAVWARDNATVSFEIVGDAHGVSNPADVTVQKGTTTGAPVVNVTKGYKVDGWYTTDACTEKFIFGNAILKDEKLYAKIVEKAEDWTTVTFKAGDHGQWADGTNVDVILKAIKGAAWLNYSTQVPAAPQQNEIGWKLADTTWDKALPSATETIPDAGLVYTAQWTEDNAEVSFQIEGIMVNGTEEFFGVTKPANQSIQKGITATDPTAAATSNIQPGYRFDGWYTDEDCTLPFVFNTAITDTTLLYAKVVVNDEDWARVTFMADEHGMLNDGAEDVATVVTDPILIGNTIGRVIPSANANAGYEFDAWYKVTEGESGIQEVLETPTQLTEVTGNMTYLAKFSGLLNVNFVINTSKAANITTSPVTISGVAKNTPWTEITVPTVVGKSSQGYSHDYVFTGWDASFPDTVTSNVTFRAQFDDVYTFAVEHADINNDADPQYPGEVTNFAKKKAGDTISSQANTPVRGYELSNITVRVDNDNLIVATTAELIQKLEDDYNITLTEDGTLSGTMPNHCIYIKYGYQKLAEHTVQYESDGTVTNMPDDIIDRYKGDVITILGTIPQRDGYDFGGWEVVDNAVEVMEGMFTMPDGDVKLKAIWTPNEEVWNFTVAHCIEGAEAPFETVNGSVLKREPNIKSLVLNAPQGYKFKEYQINGDPTQLPITIGEDGRTVSVVYEKNDLVVKHVYGDNTVYDTTQSKANVEDESVVVNAVNSGRYTKLKLVTINGVAVASSRSITLGFSEIDKYEVVFVYGKKSSDSGNTDNPSDNDSDFGEDVTILEEEVPLADGLNMIDHFAYIFGYTDGTVKPTNKISREEVSAIFYRLLSDDTRATMRSTTQDFPDVSSQRWSNTSIATLANGGVLSGYPGGEFMPGNAITRAEFAVIVSKFDNLSTADTNQFSDIENHWANDFINSAALKGWISGYPDGTFRPNEYITRAEAMTLINSVLNRKVSKEGLLENAKYWSDNRKEAWYYEAVMEATNSHDYTRETLDGDETWTAITPDKTWN